MVVTQDSLPRIAEFLSTFGTLSLDTETTGLRPYHGDRMFSLILGYRDGDGYQALYFNFKKYNGLDPSHVLTKTAVFEALGPLFRDQNKTWVMHNALFDMHMLSQDGVELAGKTWCSLNVARVVYNEHPDYSLDACLTRIGGKKDDRVEQYIEEHGLWEWVEIPGKKQRKKNKFYDRVPFDVISAYGEADAKGTLALYHTQLQSLSEQSEEYPSGVPVLHDAAGVECRLAKTLHRMEKAGVKIDRPYVVRAARYEADRLDKAVQAFKRESGRDYSASAKLFESVFASDREYWGVTEKGNPSFDSDSLKNFENPLARIVLDARDSKSRLDFYNGFLYHADADDIIHPHFNSGGTRTFRLSSSEPNLQNLTAEEATYCRDCKEGFEQLTQVCPVCEGRNVDNPEFLVRRAFIPRPGHIFFLPDYDQMEYKLMLDLAKTMQVNYFKSAGLSWDDSYFELVNKVRDGFDMHKSTAELMGVSRKYAKTLNFMLLYGGGAPKLAEALGISVSDAQALKRKYFAALPYVEFMVQQCRSTASMRGWLRNWAGYKYHFPRTELSYKAPNTIVQGGCAAVMKHAMNSVDFLCQGTRSRPVLTIHDELVCEIHEDEAETLPKLIAKTMENTYPGKHLQLTVGAEWSDKNLADKRKGYPA